jgi:hypothetical protein
MVDRSYWHSNTEEDRLKRQEAIDFLNEQNKIIPEEEYYEETDQEEDETEPIYTGEEEETEHIYTEENPTEPETIQIEAETLPTEPENPNTDKQ